MKKAASAMPAHGLPLLRRILLPMLFYILPHALFAQPRQGTITYERKIDVHRNMQDDQMKAMVPQFQTTSYQLLFRDSISIYKAMPRDEAPDPFDNNTGGMHMIVRFGG